MPKQAKEMTALEVRRLNEPGLHFVGEVPGLALQVLPSGGRTWILRVTVAGKRRDLGLGGFPAVTLAAAKDRAREYREQIRKGSDPAAQACAARQALRPVMTFRKAAHQFIDSNKAGWHNDKHVAQWTSTLESYAFPIMGDLSVADIAVHHVLLVLEQPVPVLRTGKGGATGRLWECRTETASRLRGRIEQVLDWAKGRGLRSGDNPAAWKGNLDAQLPAARKVQRTEHHAAMALEEVGAFMAELRAREGMAARALEFAILCASRSGEVRGAVWSEVDLERGIWTVPAARMKGGREHRVPLSDAAVRILNALPRFEGVDAVFPSPRGKQMSDMSLTAVMRRMGREEVPHGFRSTFRDWAAERTSYPGDMAELALSHAIGSKVEAAYRRGDQFEKRRRMMAEWAAFCATPATSGTVIGIRSKTA
jgi:integrase